MKSSKALVALGALALAGIGMSACGTKAATPASTKAQQRIANNKGYLPIYAQFSNKVTKLGYPVTIPDAIRIPLPAILEKEIKDTSKATVNGVWVGTGTPDMRMAIYTAKVFDALEIYVPPTQPFHTQAWIAQERDLNSVFATSPAALWQWTSLAGPTPLVSGVYQSMADRNMWLESTRILADKTPTLSTSTPVVGKWMTVGVCASMSGVGVDSPLSAPVNPATGRPYVLDSQQLVATVLPSSDLSHVWKVSQAVVTNKSSQC